MINKKIELLAPAGDLERLKINLLYGADAVYFGGKKYSFNSNDCIFSIYGYRKTHRWRALVYGYHWRDYTECRTALYLCSSSPDF